MDNLEKMLQMAQLPKIIEEIEKIIIQLRKKRKDKKVVRKDLYLLINQKYQINLPIKNYTPKDNNYWLSKKNHEQMAVKLAKIVQSKQKDSDKANPEISKLIIPIDAIENPAQETYTKDNPNDIIKKAFKDFEKKLDLNEKQEKKKK